MKLTLVLLLTVFLQLSFAGYAQKITYSKKNVSLEQALKEIHNQTGLLFLYTDEMLAGTKPINADFVEASLPDVLKVCFADQPLTYAVENKIIVLKRKLVTADINMAVITVKGTVTDEKNQPLPGVTVRISGTTKGVVTDNNGNYTINVPDANATLSFSLLSYSPKEVKVGAQQTINISLTPKPTALNEMVVIGYGTQKRDDINGAISSVKAADIADIPQASIDQLLQGKASGVSVTQDSGAPGSQTSVHVRGIASFGAAEPLYVIDGVEVAGAANTTGTTALSPNNAENAPSPLALLNPNDIESIDILKDASAAAIYGNRASNGVIIITTKKGKMGSARVTYDGYAGVQQAQKFIKLMNLQQYAALQNVLADAFGTQRRPELADISLLGPGTNWQDAIFRTAVQQSHQVSVSGGKMGVSYYFSGGYFAQDGIALGSSFKRYSFRSNVDVQINPWLKTGLTLSGSRTIDNIIYSDNDGIIYNVLLQAPEVPIYNSDGSFAGPPNTLDAISGVLNPVQQALSVYNRLNRNNVIGNLYNEMRLLKNLTLRSELGGNFNFSDNTIFRPSYNYGRFSNPTATLNEQQNQSTAWNWKEYLTFTQIFGKKHSLTALLGHELSSSYWNLTQQGIANFLTNTLNGMPPTLNLGTASTATVNQQVGAPHNLESEYARAIYSYNNRYSITATVRTDVSSNFAAGHQRGYFPSFAASWKISEEPFFAPLKKSVDNLKLRLGYGQVGNEQIAAYAYGSQLNSTVTGLGTGFLVARIANPDLVWERHIEYNAGIDFALLNSRIEGSIDYFDRKSSKFLFQLQLPAYLVGGSTSLGGIAPPFVNAGGIRNNGFDLNVTTHNIVHKNFKWNTSLIFSHYHNEVTSLANGLPQIIGVNGNNSLPVTRTVVGGPLGEFYGYKVKDIFRTDAQLRSAPVQFGYPVSNDPTLGNKRTWLGDIQYQDLNHDGKIDAQDQTTLGSPQPTFTYGFTNTFLYKQFSLSVFLQGSYGDKILSLMDRTLGTLASLYQNQLASEANYWSPSNPTSNIPAPRTGTDNANLQISDRYIQDGSYLRIQNVNLGYSLPVNWVKQIKLNKLRVYTSVQNVYTFTKYDGFDPEVGLRNQGPTLTNIDVGRYPSARTYVFGINAEF
jgi:TonB-linked SusC/RagA family outer membrane protein